MMGDVTYAQRTARLTAILCELDGIAVAFSGGVDSAVLLHASHAALGPRAVAVIADSPSLPRRELAEARALAAAIGAPLEVVATDELSRSEYRANSGDRCYFCKAALFEAMGPWVRERGFAALAFGEITDDLSDDRPGARAAKERSVRAPLREAGLSKADVRRYAHEHGLAVADKPASACLASRIPVGTEVTRERLARVERAEEALKQLGLRQLRVRDHGALARVEVGADELTLAESLQSDIERALAAEGFGSFETAAYRSPSGSI
jgi:uncharacterized protein